MTTCVAYDDVKGIAFNVPPGVPRYQRAVLRVKRSDGTYYSTDDRGRIIIPRTKWNEEDESYLNEHVVRSISCYTGNFYGGRVSGHVTVEGCNDLEVTGKASIILKLRKDAELDHSGVDGSGSPSDDSSSDDLSSSGSSSGASDDSSSDTADEDGNPYGYFNGGPEPVQNYIDDIGAINFFPCEIGMKKRTASTLVTNAGEEYSKDDGDYVIPRSKWESEDDAYLNEKVVKTVNGISGRVKIVGRGRVSVFVEGQTVKICAWMDESSSSSSGGLPNIADDGHGSGEENPESSSFESGEGSGADHDESEPGVPMGEESGVTPEGESEEGGAHCCP